MSVSALLTRLRHLNVRVWADAGQLRYEAPKGVMTTELLGELKTVKSELLDLLQRVRSNDVPPISPVSRDQSLPLSFSQQRLWLLDQIMPGNPAYNIPLATRLYGSLDVVALERSLHEIISRHEILRTYFVSEDGRELQRIIPEPDLALPMEVVSGSSDVEREAELQHRLVKESLQPFDLAHGPLIRTLLMQLSPEEHVLLLVIHHIAFDRWSANLLYRELAALYEAFQVGEPSPLTPPAIQYADFAVWQREVMQGPALAEQLEYWQTRMQGAEPLQLLSDRPRPRIQTFNGRRETRRMSARLLDSLQELSRKEGATLYMTLLAVFQILLQRYAGQEDVTVGTPIANRHQSDVEGMFGFFVNMLALRTDLSGDPSFRELLGRVRADTLAAYAHQDLPFERLVEELGVERNLGSNPLIQVVFALQNAPLPPGKIGELRMERQLIDNATTRFDLELHLEETQNGLTAIAVYNSDLFEWQTIQRMLAQYEMLLCGVIENADRRISGIPLLDATERQLLAEWNDTATEYPAGVCAFTLFEAHAAQSPDAVAVVSGDVRLSYGELNARANQLAHHLISCGIGPETLVGICLDRSLELPVAILGVQKAGAAYVPLDPSYPERRLAYMLDDTDASLLLTCSSLLSGLTNFSGELLCMDDAGEQLDPQSTANPEQAATADNLAYIIYTSGSTGEPKGVEINHAGLTNLVCWHIRTYQLDPADRITHLSGLGFDASVWDLWPCLAAGAGLYLVPEELRRSPRRLWSWIAAHGITLSFMPTPLAEAALREALPDGLALRVLLTGGDRLHGDLTDKALPFRVVNHYGPTENTVVATCADVDLLADGEPHIGKPIDNVHTYILDKQQQPVPVGIAGELYIGGNSLARGYHNQPTLTAEKFIANPFINDPAERLYRTGDRVRYLADGNIEFLGRVDDQIKLRGFRIEPGEIEAALRDLPNIEQAIVLLREDVPGNEQLVAYVTGGPVDSFMTMLKTRLPEFMVPVAIVPLDELPLTANGKIDRAVLPQPDCGENPAGDEIDESFSKTEGFVAEIWQDLLKVDRVGLHDNFFHIGGHSLLATQLVNQFESYFDLDVPLMAVFESPTVAGLAAFIDGLLLQELEDSTALGDKG